jgi:hypothetical protein
MLSVRGIPAPWQAGSMHLSANRQLSCIVILSPCLCSPFPCWSSRGGFFVKVPTCGSMSDWPTFAPITSSTSLPKKKALRVASCKQPQTLSVMSRRRGVVRSDDEDAAPTQSRRSTATARPSGRSQKQQRQTETVVDPAVLELPNLAFLANEHAEALRAPLKLRDKLAELVANAMNVISDTAVAVEDVSDENSEVSRLYISRVDGV